MGRPAQKRRKLNDSATEEVIFDPSARHEYLTGFHKRKVQRTKAAQEAAARRARQEKIDDRRKLREERKAEIERHVREVNALLPSARPASESEDEGEESEDFQGWNGIDNLSTKPVDHEAEYLDEDKYTTVTVEEVDISRTGISRLHDDSDDVESEDESEAKAKPGTPDKQKKPLNKKAKDKKPKKKKKGFRYEGPAERKMNRLKEKARKSKQAKLRRGD